MPKLSVVIPVYNEERTIKQLLSLVENAPLPAGMEREIIIVDDCSQDGTREILRSLENKCRVVFKDKNEGKGAALRRGFKEAGGDIIIIQDADLEYNPNEYALMIGPILDGRADAVFGSRFIGSQPHRVLYFWHYLGNRFLTLLTNLFSNLNLTDMETCYKAFSRQALDKIAPRLAAKRFGIEPEIAIKLAKSRLRVYEVGISYSGRTYSEGKKINWKDGAAAIWHIIRYGLFG